MWLYSLRWVLIYNANLDRSPTQRQSLSELKRALRTWEVENTQAKSEIADIAKYEVRLAARSSFTHVVRTNRMTQRANKEHFKQLVEAARPKKYPPSEISPSNPPSYSASHQIPSPEDVSDTIVEDSEEAGQ
jgi:E3 ubiquitin-protein ligase RAD18